MPPKPPSFFTNCCDFTVSLIFHRHNKLPITNFGFAYNQFAEHCPEMEASTLTEEVNNSETIMETSPAVETTETSYHTEEMDTPAASETNQQINSNKGEVENEEEEREANKIKVQVQVHQNQPRSEINKKQQAEPETETEVNEPVNQNKIDTERTIAELCLRCPDEQIRRHLQLYEYGRGTEHIRKKLGAITNEHLTNLLVFLHNGKVNHKIPSLKKDLVHDIIGRIQNLLPDICAFCKVKYKLDFDEESTMPCAHCYQSSHKECVAKLINTNLSTDPVEHPTQKQVQALINPFNIPGVYYLCKACDTNLLQNLDKNEISKGTTTAEDANEFLLSVPVTNVTKNNTEKSKESSITIIDQDEIYVSNFRSRLKQKEVNNSQPIQSSTQRNTNTNPQNSQQKKIEDDSTTKSKRKKDYVCKFYEKGSCIHGKSGDNCNYAHPEICRKYTQHGSRQPRGCNRGKKCKFLHPVMCIYSMRKGECMNSRCSFRHILGTKRPPPNGTNDTNEKKDSREPATTDNAIHRTTDTNADNNNNASPDHFLAMIRLVKAEFIKEMDAKLEKMSSQMQQSVLRSTSQHPQLMLSQDPQAEGHLTNTNLQMQQSQMCTHPTIHPGQLQNDQRSLSHVPPQAFKDLQEAPQTIAHPQMMQAVLPSNQGTVRDNIINQAQIPSQHHHQTGRTTMQNPVLHNQVAATQNQQTQQINQRMQNQTITQTITHPQMMQAAQHISHGTARDNNKNNQAQIPSQHHYQTGRTATQNPVPYSQVAATQNQQTQQINHRMQNHHQLLLPPANQAY